MAQDHRPNPQKSLYRTQFTLFTFYFRFETASRDAWKSLSVMFKGTSGTWDQILDFDIKAYLTLCYLPGPPNSL